MLFQGCKTLRPFILWATLGVVHGLPQPSFGQDKQPMAEPGNAAAPGDDVDSNLASASKVSLAVGDLAPPLQVDQWLRGEPVEGYSQDHLYVIEFWATWCMPCIKAMPHLHELAERHAKDGLIVVALTTADEANTMEQVAEFVTGRGEKYNFRYAFCQGRATYRAFMEAAGETGIPCSFVIDREGKIAYIGMPSDLDYVLERLVKGEWRGKADADELKQMNESLGKVSELALTDPDKAMQILAQVERVNPQRTKSFDFAYAKVVVMCLAKRYDDAKGAIEATAPEMRKQQNWGSLAMLSGVLASLEVNPEGVHREYALANMEAAFEAGKENWEVIFEVGMGYQMAGEHDKYVACLEKVIALCPDETLTQTLKSMLARPQNDGK